MVFFALFVRFNSVHAIKEIADKITDKVDIAPNYGFDIGSKKEPTVDDLGAPVQKKESTLSKEIDNILKEDEMQSQPIEQGINKTEYVETGELQKVMNVRIVGNNFISDDEIKNLIVTKRGSYFTRNSVVQDLQSLFKTGYFIKSSIEAQPVLVDGGIELNYYLKENSLVKDVYILGNNTTDKVNAYEMVADLIGKPQSIPNTSKKLREIEEAYSAKGLVLARISDISWDPDSGIFRIYVAEGNISEIEFEGNGKTKEIYLRKLIGHTKANEPYNEKVFLKDFKRLRGTGYFKDVKRELIADEGAETYKLKIVLEETKNTKLGVGGGVNTGTGVFGNASLRVGNIKGEGHNLDINGVFGTGIGANAGFNNNEDFFRAATQTRISSSYAIPYFKNSQNTVRAFGNYVSGNNFQVDFSEQTAFGGGLGLSRTFGLFDNQSLNSSLSFNFLDLNGADDSNYISSLVDGLLEEDGLDPDKVRNNPGINEIDNLRRARRNARDTREEQLVSGNFVNLQSTYTFRNLDSNDRPRKGWRTSFTAEPVLGFGDINSHTKVRASVSRYFALPKDSSILINARVGHQLLGDIPRFNQFRLGGVSGVRGYLTLSQLGFGNSLAIGTAEIRTPIYNFVPRLKRIKLFRSVDVAAFSDFGLVSGENTFNNITNRLSRAWSVGFGLRVALPFVGRIRVDAGFPLVEALTNNQFFRFNFGPADRF
ncbi:MAG: BamA/TamA family outer membrane protein [Candidatus Caenarcaniphilales bacterium]|nr:BamA/TamA family outer membrane protein [Candidatus Caenarcaniphilales bacterium]